MIQAAPKPCGIVARPAKKAMPAAPRLAAAVTPAPQRASAAKSSPAVLPPGPVLQAAKGEPVPDDEHAVKDELPSDDEQAHPVAAGMDTLDAGLDVQWRLGRLRRLRRPGRLGRPVRP